MTLLLAVAAIVVYGIVMWPGDPEPWYSDNLKNKSELTW